MKTIIFSLTVLLAFLSGSASAQRMNGYNANANAINNHGNNHGGHSDGGVIIDNLHSESFKGVIWPNTSFMGVVPKKTNATYSLPDGIVPKSASAFTNARYYIPRSLYKYNSKEWAIILPTH